MYKNIKYLNITNGEIFQLSQPSNIPPILHMIWVGEKPVPKFFVDYFLQWKKLMPSWYFMIWTNEKLTTEYFDENFLELIKTVKPPAQKADLIRYYILEKWGGFYVDADVIPKRSLEDLRYIDNDVIVCNDILINWEFISTGFIASVPHHPAFKKMYENVYSIDLENKEYHITTGPAYFARHIFSHDWGGKYPAVLNPIAFYTNMNRLHVHGIFITNLLYDVNEKIKNYEETTELLVQKRFLENILDGIIEDTRAYRVDELYTLHREFTFGSHQYHGDWD
jgi:hypothetical protein